MGFEVEGSCIEGGFSESALEVNFDGSTRGPFTLLKKSSSSSSSSSPKSTEDESSLNASRSGVLSLWGVFVFCS